VVMNEGRIQQIGSPTDIYNEPQNEFVASFIGESNIINGVMPEDRKVIFAGHEFECVDTGFAPNETVDVVVRPEDIFIVQKTEGAQMTATVQSCTFKGVHYEMFVNTDTGYEFQIEDYNAFEPGSTVGLIIKPQDIQVMHRLSTCNTFEGEVIDENHVFFIDGEFECRIPAGLSKGDKVKVEVPFDKVELMDYQEEGDAEGSIKYLSYKGNHYHIQVRTSDRQYLFADTQDAYDRGDLVGIKIAPKDIKISRLDD